MAVKTESSPFGSATRTRILVALRLLTESYPRELSRLLGVPLSSAQKALASLERDGLVAARALGRLRAYRLEPRYFAHRELSDLLLRLGEPDRDLRSRVAALRRRPRRAGKAL